MNFRSTSLRARRLGIAIVLLVLAASASLVPGAASAAPEDEAPTAGLPPVVLDRPVRGAAAVAALDQHASARRAAPGGADLAELRAELLRDDTLWLDRALMPFYIDPAVSAAELAATGPLPEEIPPFPPSQTFLLHSKMDSNRTIYLDFDGATISNTAWNSQAGLPAGSVAPAFDLDGAPFSFSTNELAFIQYVWERVSEDFAWADVNVTTQAPAAATLDRTDVNDLVYGTRALITNAPAISAVLCPSGCGGIAYNGIFDEPNVNTVLQPAFVFQNGLGGTLTHPKLVAEAVSHEVGHNLGLSHDGTSTLGYYAGHNHWAPIMGNSYNRPITQWSRGEYTDANNTQDDFSVIAANGVNRRADDHVLISPNGTALPPDGLPVNGIIEHGDDADYFVITTTGPARVTARPALVSPNLDIELTRVDATGAPLDAPVNPVSGPWNADFAQGLPATVQLPGAGTHHLRVRGTGALDPLTDGYSAYGSVGRYSIYAESTPPTGGQLRVVTSPAVPSQVIVDGVVRDTWSTTWMKIEAGPHQVCFTGVPGFLTPACQNITVTADATTTVTGSFTRLGNLRVITSPALPATITLNGQPAGQWGIWTDLPAGAHEICFGAVANFAPPACSTVDLAAGSPLLVTGTYTSSPGAAGPPATGTLRVTTNPAVPARIVVDGIIRDTWGATIPLPAGARQVCFTDIPGFITPPCQNVNVTVGAQTNVVGTYTALHLLRVITEPAVPATITIDGVARNDWGVWTHVPAGARTVCFGPIAGLVAPPCQMVALNPGGSTLLSGMYALPSPTAG